MLKRTLFLLLSLALTIATPGCQWKGPEQSIFLVVDDRNLGGRVYTETINQILTAMPQQDLTTIKVLRLGNRQGSAYRAQINSYSLPEKFDCEAELLKDAPFSTKFKRQAREQYIEEHKGKCIPGRAQYSQTLNEQMGKLRRILLDAPDNRECISLATIGERLMREAATLQGQRIILLTTGINSPSGCGDFPLEAVSLSGRPTLQIVQLPLEGANEFYERRTAQLRRVFPQGQLIPSANVAAIFSVDSGALAKR